MNRHLSQIKNLTGISREDFDYDYRQDFLVRIQYTFGEYEYIFYNNIRIDRLDYKRMCLITGVYEKDIEVFYKQAMSNIYRKLGKLRPGREIVYVNNTRLYNTGRNHFNYRYEKELDSYDNENYIDTKYKSKDILFNLDNGTIAYGI